MLPTKTAKRPGTNMSWSKPRIAILPTGAGNRTCSAPYKKNCELLDLSSYTDLRMKKDGNCHLVQVEQGQTSPPNLVKMLEDPSVLKLFHFGRFDIAALFHTFGATTAPVYCTKIASKMIRTFTDRHGLKNLLQELLSVDISKHQQQSDWGAAELSEAQLDYAASDVLYLHALREELDKRLAREGRTDLAKACFEFLPTRAKLDIEGWPDIDIFAH